MTDFLNRGDENSLFLAATAEPGCATHQTNYICTLPQMPLGLMNINVAVRSAGLTLHMSPWISVWDAIPTTPLQLTASPHQHSITMIHNLALDVYLLKIRVPRTLFDRFDRIRSTPPREVFGYSSANIRAETYSATIMAEKLALPIPWHSRYGYSRGKSRGCTCPWVPSAVECGIYPDACPSTTPIGGMCDAITDSITSLAEIVLGWWS